MHNLNFSEMTAKIISYLPLFLLPLALSLAFTPIVRLIALKNGFIAYPRSDRWHERPTALLGGIGIYLASIVSALLFGAVNKNSWGLFAGATVLFVTGLIDDKFHLRPYTKLFIQIIAGCIAIFSGVVLRIPGYNIFVIPLALLWIVGVTNSFNLLDNIDGLAGGIAAIAALMLFFSSLFISENPLAKFAIIMSGAIFGFLPYNFNKAKIFMGDSGSMFLGYSLALISIAGTVRHVSSLLMTILLPVFILSVPIFDTIFVIITRKMQGKGIFQGGKDHTSHRLVALGLSPTKTVLLLCAVSIACGLIAILYSNLNIFVISVIIFLSIAVLLIFGLYLSDATSHAYKAVNKPTELNGTDEDKTILNAMLLYKRRFAELLLDVGLICIAYYSAYFLRFEGENLSSNIYLIRESLIWIIVIKISIFYMFGIYRGVWRYISISDLLTVFKVVSLSSIASILFLTFAFRFRFYSRAIFFLDWLILLFLITGSRISFRILGEFLSQAREKGRNILIFGAGDTGEMVIREIKRNKALNYNPIGFIDDNPAKIGNEIQGVVVLGSRRRIRNLIQEQEVREVIIATPSLDTADLSDIISICQEFGVSYRRVKGILDK